LINGDCIEELPKIESDSIGLTIFSPPFPELYCYSNDVRDMGNCVNYDEFKSHFSFLPPELYRVTMEGRNVCIHCMDTPVQKGKHGYIGLRNFSDLIVAEMEAAGFIYHSRITIWKNPVTEMQRTKALGLLHKQVKKDSTMSRVGIPDYVLVFRKDGNREFPVRGGISVDTWQQFASPVWNKSLMDYSKEKLIETIEFLKYEIIKLQKGIIGTNFPNEWLEDVWMDIDQSDTLNARAAREEEDEKHICPLQLEVIRRLTILYSNPGDICMTTFAGIGSEPYQFLELDRAAMAIELKKAYYDQMVKNCKSMVESKKQRTLFSLDIKQTA
jgi:DNA modification methylase